MKLKDIIDSIDELAQGSSSWDEIVAHMVANGWGLNADGKVASENLGKTFDTWEDAVKACISVASE